MTNIVLICRNHEICRLLLQVDCNAGHRDNQSKSAYDLAENLDTQRVFHSELFHCIAKGDVDGADALLTSGISVHTTDGSELCDSPLHWAATFGHMPVSAVLFRVLNIGRVFRYGKAHLFCSLCRSFECCSPTMQILYFVTLRASHRWTTLKTTGISTFSWK
jgi:hypothetical protein